MQSKNQSRFLIITIFVSILSIISASCAVMQPTEMVEIKPDQIEEKVEVANPASVFCQEQGYNLEIRTDKDGDQYGVCVFTEGGECEEWAFYRGECGLPVDDSSVMSFLEKARDSAVAYVRENLTDQAPGENARWQGELNDNFDQAGRTSAVFTSGAWKVYVTKSTVSIDGVIYTVVVTMPETDTNWEIKLDPDYEVIEAKGDL